ncbi:hypothetical protein GLYMA_16G069100v4 [Glycine max]|uniref:Treslin N-terminal domain-containing protein n=1 Tax=Glycine max TaxID=3847 RepID=I1MLS9_SOYBN|nr:uncharacterized protein LOC102660949 isoform X1 [Glycine max]KRH07129.1 hypothetical protein GLYMA_16G069100v4 [Glycine max]|eukprot:XP_006599081.1 uncharacterized protein LOC102660949 isoform X1 [Glycine max]
MASDSDLLTQYSHTRRIVLLIDLTSLHHHHLQDYTKRLVSFFETLISFPPLSSSLFSFKFFFSSLSPLLSFSKLQPFLPNPTLSFNTPSSTLAHLSHTLSSLLSSSFHSFSTPNASHLAESLSQLLHDHSWEHPDDNDHTPHHAIPPNLVLLFSPSFTSLTSLASFLDSDAGLVAHSASFCGRLSLVFSNVSRAFASKGIHCCWISIGSEIGRIETDEAREACCLLETGLGRLGWGFCSLDSILLGSALVPFGLVYPKIGVLWDSVCFSSRDANNVGAQLSLRMLDVKGIPIEYSDCDLEFVDVKVLGGSGDLNLQGGGCGRKERFWKLCLDGGVKLEVKIVQRCDAFVGIEEWLSDSVLVREDFRGLKKKVKGGLDGFFADRVLELVAGEFGCEWRRKQVPVWEILLSFLYREGCWALVSVTNGKGGSCIAILRPFTVFAALLSVLGDPHGACSFGEENVGQYVRMVDNEICGSDGKFNKKEDLLDSQGKKSTAVVEGHQRKKMVDLNTVRDLTWNLFCKLVYDQFETNLLEVYYTMEGNKSKKLRFLKCWIKQMKKSGCSSLALLEKPKPNPIVAEEASSKLNDLTQNAEQPIFSFASAEINPEPEALRIQEDAVLDFRSETSESFFSNLADRINRGIESEVVDTGALAERLVNSSIYWLCQKVDRETISQSQSPLKDHNACGSMIASELMKLLLREPKEIVAKHKSQNPSKLHLSMIGFHSGPIADHVVREYELQILFRMEILQSEVGSEVEDSCKQKFVKQICLLLENIMCHMETGFFGDWTLENYVTKIIKNRYSLALEDVVQRIYNKMDLLLFADEDEAPNSLLNSEDSYKPLKKKTYRDEVGENDFSSQPISAENEPFQLQKDGSGRFQRIEDGDHKKLIEAKEKRERAQRFSSFTSSMPVLRRVRATKQKGMKPKTDLLQRVQKRKERERASYGTVCETPMTGNKRSSPRARSSDDDNGLADRSQSYGSVSKALFMDDL